MMATTEEGVVVGFEDLPEELAQLGGPWSSEFSNQVNLYTFSHGQGWSRLTDLRANEPEGAWYLAATPMADPEGRFVFYVELAGSNFGRYEDLGASLWSVDLATGVVSHVGDLPPFSTLDAVTSSAVYVAVAGPEEAHRMYAIDANGALTDTGCRRPVAKPVGTDPDRHSEAQTGGDG